jgi:hypothetical protein
MATNRWSELDYWLKEQLLAADAHPYAVESMQSAQRRLLGAEMESYTKFFQVTLMITGAPPLTLPANRMFNEAEWWAMHELLGLKSQKAIVSPFIAKHRAAERSAWRIKEFPPPRARKVAPPPPPPPPDHSRELAAIQRQVERLRGVVNHLRGRLEELQPMTPTITSDEDMMLF